MKSPEARIRGPVAVVTVNYKTPHLVIEALRSIANEEIDGVYALVIDNASSDDSVAVIDTAIREEGWSPWARVWALPKNGGFSYGNNAAIKYAREAYPDLSCVVLLNPDAFFRPGALRALLEFCEDNPSAGIVGAGIENADGSRVPSAHTFPSPLGELEGAAKLHLLTSMLSPFVVTPPIRSGPRRCDWVSGACMAIRPMVFDRIGLFDEGYFLYYEEIDFCRRAYRAGFSCWCLPEARIVHLEGSSTGISMKRRRRSSFWFASRRRFFAKHYGVVGWIIADALWAIGRGSLLLRRLLGLGGLDGVGDDPLRFSRDLLTGDLVSLWRWEISSSALRDRY